MRILLPLLGAALCLGCQSALTQYRPAWIAPERVAVPPRASLERPGPPALVGALDAEAACLQEAARILGRPLDSERSRLLSGVGLGAWSRHNGAGFRWRDSPEPYWAAGASALGLQATFLAASNEAAFLGGLREQLAAGRPVLLNVAYPRETPSPSARKSDPPSRLDLALVVIGFEPGFFTVLNPFDLLKQGGSPFRMAESDLVKASAAHWNSLSLGWSHAFVVLGPGPQARDLRPALRVMADACVGSPVADFGWTNGSQAVLWFSDLLAQIPTATLRQEQWNAVVGQIRLLAQSRKWAGEYLARSFPEQPQLQEASAHLLVAADDYGRCFSDYAEARLTEEVIFAIGGIMRDAALRERSAGEALAKAAVSSRPIWWKED
jgi:hypothetical protein